MVGSAQWESWQTRVNLDVFLQNEDLLKFHGDIDKTRFLLIVKYMLHKESNSLWGNNNQF